MAEDGCEAVGLGPVVVIVVAEDDDAIFTTLGIAVLVFLDFGDGHGGKGLADDGFETTVFLFRDDLPSVELEEAIDFLAVAGIPEFTIVRMEQMMAEEGRGFLDDEGGGADVTSQDITGGADVAGGEDGVGGFPTAEEFAIGDEAGG